jgi:hypothetical protein
MKNYISKSSILIFLVALVISSCSKNDDGGTTTVTPFITNINGQQFLPTSIPLGQMSNSGRFIIINAINTVSDETITLSIGDASGTEPELAVGTYPITSGGTSIAYFTDNNSYASGDTGQIIITALDTESRKISGTFEGSVTGSFGSTGSFTFSNGEFTDITYSVQ